MHHLSRRVLRALWEDLSLMWMRALFAMVVLFGSSGAASFAAADDSLLRIGVQNERPPFSFRDDDGELQGFDVDIAWRSVSRWTWTASWFRSSSPP
jgi:hypothetical protein